MDRETYKRQVLDYKPGDIINVGEGETIFDVLSIGGVKHDQGKPRMELIPPELLTEVAKVLTFGADKYEDRNWEKGLDWGRVYGALQRHLWVWWSGQDKDEETGESHLAHAGCCIAFLIAYEKRNLGEDTREKIL